MKDIQELKELSHGQQLEYFKGVEAVYPSFGDHYGEPLCLPCALEHMNGTCNGVGTDTEAGCCCSYWDINEAELIGSGYGDLPDYEVKCLVCETSLN